MNITIIDKEETTLIVENNTIKLSNNQQIPFSLIDTLVLNHKKYYTKINSKEKNEL